VTTGAITKKATIQNKQTL